MQASMNLTQKPEQTLTITKQMEQSIKILEMDTVELQDYIQDMALENPAMDMDIPAADSPDTLMRRKMEWLERQSQRDKEYVGYYDPADDFSIEKIAAAPIEESLQEHLLSQAGFVCDGIQLRAVEYLADFLDGNGYLLQSLQEIASHCRYSTSQLQEALKLIQSLEPAGVGASSLVECLLLQLPQNADLEREIVKGYLKDLAKNRPEKIAKALKVSCIQVNKAFEVILRLNPKPGSAYSRQLPSVYVTPDVLVTAFQDRYYVLPCEFSYPQVQLSSSITGLMRQTSDKETLQYIEQKIKQVEWLQKCIAARSETLLAVTKAIVKQQERFFRYGPHHLNVLRMSDIAAALGIHESTVSRAVKNKYLQCAHGVYSLRHFFVQGTKTGDGDTSSHTIKNKIAQLIAGEEKSAPLSDQRIADALCAQGCEISRRTVAKYREQLGIPNTAYRR